MAIFDHLIFMRLHPFERGYSAVGCLPEQEFRYSQSNATIHLDLDPCGWNEATISMRTHSLWKRNSEVSRLVVTIRHWDGEVETFKMLRSEEKWRTDAFCERTVRLGPADGLFSGNISITIDCQSDIPLARRRERCPTYTAHYFYEPTQADLNSAKERYQRLWFHPPQVDHADKTALWVKFNGKIEVPRDPAAGNQVSSDPARASSITDYPSSLSEAQDGGRGVVNDNRGASSLVDQSQPTKATTARESRPASVAGSSSLAQSIETMRAEIEELRREEERERPAAEQAAREREQEAKLLAEQAALAKELEALKALKAQRAAARSNVGIATTPPSQASSPTQHFNDHRSTSVATVAKSPAPRAISPEQGRSGPTSKESPKNQSSGQSRTSSRIPPWDPDEFESFMARSNGRLSSKSRSPEVSANMDSRRASESAQTSKAAHTKRGHNDGLPSGSHSPREPKKQRQEATSATKTSKESTTITTTRGEAKKPKVAIEDAFASPEMHHRELKDQPNASQLEKEPKTEQNDITSRISSPEGYTASSSPSPSADDRTKKDKESQEHDWDALWKDFDAERRLCED